MLNKKIAPLSSGLILGFSILLISIVLYLLYTANQPLIEESIRKNRLSHFHHFISTDAYDNDLLTSMVEVDTMKYYPAIDNEEIKILFVESITKNGYSGDIKIITALDNLSQKPYPRVLGVAILEHKETPGLGDKIERKKSDWILQFESKNYSTDKNWKLKKEGGEFDSLTGASISSKAVIDEVKRVLLNWNQFLAESD